MIGRAGEKGTAYTLITEKDKEFAGHLVRNLESVDQEVPSALLDLAMQVNFFFFFSKYWCYNFYKCTVCNYSFLYRLHGSGNQDTKVAKENQLMWVEQVLVIKRDLDDPLKM